MVIPYYVKSVYGKDLKYVADARLASLIRQLTLKETIDDDDIYALRELGHTFEQVFAPTAK